MRTIHTSLGFQLLLLCCFFGCPLAGNAAALKAGVAATDITPPVGWRMSGYFYERLSTNIHDPLQAKALVLEQGTKKAALVCCDLIGISHDLSSRVRLQASRKTGIPAEHILLAATHSHTGPLYFGALREHLHQAAIAHYGKDPFEATDYPGILAERLVDTIVRANRRLAPAHLEVCKTRKDGLSFNRRYEMKDGSFVTNPGKTNANIARPAGPIDPQLEVLLVMNPENKGAIASFTSFALHADTVGGTEYSADFPLYLERALRRLLGSDLISLFGNSTCGDINHIDVSDPRPQKGHAEAARIGGALADAIIASFHDFKPVTRPALAIRSTKVTVPLQQYSAQETAQARQDMPKIGTKEVAFLKQVEIYKVSDLKLRGVDELPLEVQAFRLGPDTAIVGLPGEVFVELGLAIKKASPFAHTLIVELSNDCIGYIPTKKAFAEGGYETINSRVKPGGGEMLVEAATRLLKELKTAP